MARPQKSPEERRTKHVNVALSPREIARLQDRAGKVQTTVTDFVRSAALNKPLQVQESNSPDFMTRQELRRIGNNLNQIARVLNADGKHDPSELSALCGKLDALFDKWLNYDPASSAIRPQL